MITKHYINLKYLKQFTLLISSIALIMLISSCTKPKETTLKNDEDICKEFLTNVYSSSKDDVKALKECFKKLELAKENKEENCEEYTLYLKNKYNINDETFDKLYKNRYLDFYIVQSMLSGEYYSPDSIELEYIDSMKYYNYKVNLNDDILEGTIRLEDHEIVDCEINFFKK